MAEFKLGRIRFVWKDSWAPSTTYYVDDVIRYGGRTYICAVGHTSDSTDFNTDLTYSPTKWNQMSDGQSWKGDWAVSTFYKINDIVKYGGLLYVCTDSHTSNSSLGTGAAGAETTTGLEVDAAKWDLFAEGFDWKTDWTVLTRYKVNDLVKYGGTTYVCKTAHTSTATVADGLETQQSYWDYFNQGIEYKGDWTSATRYKVNDVVKRGAGLWIVKAAQSHTSTSDFAADVTSGYWEQFVEGFEYENNWNIGTPYQSGDIVRYGGNQYVSKTQHTGTVPTASSQTDWDLLSENFTYQGDWSINTSYKIGDAVRLNGYTYRAVKDSPSTVLSVTATDATNNRFTVADTSALVANMAVRFTSGTIGNVFEGATYYIKTVTNATQFTISIAPAGTEFVPTTATGTMVGRAAAIAPNTTYWYQVASGFAWQSTWTDDNEYFVGDVVRFGSNSYICIQNHRSEGDDGSTVGAAGGGADNSRPDQDITGTYWNAFTIGSDVSVLTTEGDMVYYSGAGPTRLPIGEEGQVLVSTGTLPEWRSLGKTDQIYYVAPHGTDGLAPVHGLSLDRPFKSIRHACEQIEDGPRNPNAQHLLERNRVFLQRETSSWIDYQVANAGGSGIWNGFDFDEYKCERDVGFIIDRIIWDLGHGGNLKVRAAALSFVNGFSADGEFSAASEDKPYGGAGLAAEAQQSVAAYTYLQTIIGNVLANTAPAVAYQDSNDSTAVAAQYFNTALVTETGVTTTVASLLKIVTDTVTAGDTSAIPERIVPNALVYVKAGQYKEILPIIVPAEVCILGDEVRTVNVDAADATENGSDITDSYYSIETLKHLKGFIDNVVQGTTVTPTTGNTTAQDQTWPVADDTETPALTAKLADVIMEQIDFKLGVKHTTNLTEPTGYNAGYLAGYGTAKKNVTENKKFLQEEVIQFIKNNYPTLKHSKTKCRQDVGYIVDAFSYDLTYGGNYQILNAAKAYWDGESSTSALNKNGVTQTIASYNYLKTLLGQIVRNQAITPLQTNTARYLNSDAGATPATFVAGGMDIILNTLAGDSTGADLPFVTVTTTASNVITTSAVHGLQVGDAFIPLESSNNLVANTKYWIISTPATNTFTVSLTFGGSVVTLTDATGLSVPAHVENYPAVTNAVSSTTALITAAETLDAQQEALATLVTTYITNNFPTLTYDSAKCKRDTRLILEAVMFDFMLGAGATNADATNFATHIAALAYLRSTSSDVYTLGQKTATRASFKYLASVIAADTATYLNSDATAAARVVLLMDKLDTIFFSATNEGDVCATDIRNRDYARLKLEENRAFIKAEVSAYIDQTFSDTVTATDAGTNSLTITDTSWLVTNAAIKFTGTVIGGLATGTTYYVKEIINATSFTVSTTRYGANVLGLSTASGGTMGVEIVYDETACARDVDKYIDAMKWDLQWSSNYKSRYCARYYANSVTGSMEEDFFYLRNGTGLRNMTLDGLRGDLLPPNEYGTSRVSAGAYASLDPGWGVDDFRTWIIARSPYVQNVATFGNAAIGQKIDGALHAGGNDSIVSNDFTQLISDGIGAWVANNGRAELVSVFTYYSHIGYLATEGGRIRGTNGNNSYGDFGSVAEGFDSTETAGTAIVDNRLQFEATVGSVMTDNANEILNFEFTNAGSEYTETEWGLFGAGSNAKAEQDKEFRDDSVFEVRLLDNVDDSTTAPEAEGNYGGFGYITNSNTAQGGTTSQITIAATDSETSLAYIGMRVYLDGGTGVGQFGNIATYNSGTKVATVTKPSTGAAGWDHIVPGTTIAAPDASTTYTIEPQVTFSAPTHSATARTATGSTTWTGITYSEFYNTYATISQNSTTGSGSGATVNVTAKGTKYKVDLIAGGTGYVENEVLTFNGAAVGGTTGANNITLTITSVNASSGAILAFDKDGTARGGTFVAISSASGTTTNTSVDATTFSAGTALPVSTTWTGIAAGRLQRVISAGNFVVGRSYTITTSGDTPWLTIGSTSIIAGTTFVATGVGTFTSIAGEARENAAAIVAIAGGSGVDDVAYSLDAGATYVAGGNLPSTGTWNAIGYGAGNFMAIKTGTNAVALSITNGVSWTSPGTLPSTTTWESIAYGQGYWVAVASGGTAAAYSSDLGVTWAAATLPSSSNWNSVTYGNNRFVAVSSTNGTAAAVSIDGGVTWTASTLPATAQWSNVEYGQGMFVAVSNGANYATSPDGIVWTARTHAESNGLVATAFGNPQQVGSFLGVRQGSGNGAMQIKAGATTTGRAFVATEKIFAIRLVEPGSGYSTAPTLTITDPNNTYEAPTQVRIGKGALGCPSFTNRGTGYTSASADLLSGNGFADLFQSGQFVAVRRLSKIPAVGSNVVFGHLPERTFKLVQVISLLGSYNGSYTAFLQVAPDVTVFDTPPDGAAVTTRIRYSQVRLTGHDFLDVGTGGFTTTNYPNTPTQLPDQANETKDNNGGRVFFTSTDQDGNFRVGDLFTIEQSTGVATLNADAFNISGLQELTLGEVTLGGNSASVQEFSTDPFFSANSDNIVPTQRAIKSYISSQIGGGGASLNVNSVTAGFITIQNNTITTTTGGVIEMNAKFNFKGGVVGLPLAYNYFLN